jgi:glutamyl-tRNA synthetase
VSSSSVRVRFAPSPSGDLHVGNIRTALYDWAYARHTGGTFVFRIEDTDRSRVTEEYIQAAIESMRWLGLDWDEGPEKGGPYGPYRQSERLDIYQEWAQRFLDSGHAYLCYESPEEAEARVERQKANKEPVGYDGHSRNLTDEQRAAYEAEGRKPVIRFRMPEGTTTFTDLIRGEVTFENHLVPDFVIVRADGSPLYTLAVAVDDVLMKITHVVRGEDLLSSTPRQIAVYRAMGVAEEDFPVFAHLPFVMGNDNSKLSKRHGAVNISQYRADGFLPEAMCNYLALLGWSFGDEEREEFDKQELAAAFTLDRVNRSAARFDPKKLDSINAAWIRRLDAADLRNRLLPFLQRGGLIDDPPTDEQLRLLEGGAPLVQERMVHLNEAVGMLGFLFTTDDAVTISDDARPMLSGDGATVLQAAIKALEDLAEFTTAEIEAALRAALIEGLGLKPKNAFGAVRVALTGRRVSPPLFESIELLGRDRTLARLRAAAAVAS